MHRPGHYGAALLAYSPVGFVVLAAGFQWLAVVGAGIAVAGAMIPDVDQRIPVLSHRGPTHTVYFAGVVAIIGGAVGGLIGSPIGPAATLGLGTFGFTVTGVTVVSHLLADLLTPGGVDLFWNGETWSLDVCRADSAVGNYGLLIVGIVAAVGAAVAGRALSLAF